MFQFFKVSISVMCLRVHCVLHHRVMCVIICSMFNVSCVRVISLCGYVSRVYYVMLCSFVVRSVCACVVLSLCYMLSLCVMCVFIRFVLCSVYVVRVSFVRVCYASFVCVSSCVRWCFTMLCSCYYHRWLKGSCSLCSCVFNRCVLLHIHVRSLCYACFNVRVCVFMCVRVLHFRVVFFS